MPTRVDVDVWRGNTLPLVEWAWPDGYVATGACQLTVWIGDTLLITADGGVSLIVDADGRRLLWARSPAESRSIPLGRIARYEIEDRSGGERTIFQGVIVGLGGLNLDGAESDSAGQLDFSDPNNSSLQLLGWI